MSQDAYFNFVQSLAGDLNRDDIKLPSFPDVVIRIRAALDDPDTTGRDIATILGVDAALASRILILANSTYHNPAGIKIESLDAAVGRVGFEQVRTAAIAYAVEQLHASKGLENLKDELRANWSAGIRLAAMSETIARHCTGLDGDSAFLAGLLNRIGVLYIYTKVNDYPDLLSDRDARQSLIDEWAAPIGQSIVANWNFPEEIQATLNPDDVDAPEARVEANLADVVTTARMWADGSDLESQDLPPVRRLNMTSDKMPAIMESYQQRLDSLAAAVR